MDESDPGPDPGLPDLDLMAAEYVLGVLDGAGMARCGALRRGDPAFAGLVAEWEARLMPMAAAVPEVAPPANLLARIEVAAGLRAPGRAGAWRAATGAAPRR